jgi:hypothetical protein
MQTHIDDFTSVLTYDDLRGDPCLQQELRGGTGRTLDGVPTIDAAPVTSARCTGSGVRAPRL